jgi:membrane-associated phospholipid phosphatase
MPVLWRAAFLSPEHRFPMSPSTRAKWLVIGTIVAADALGLGSLGIHLNSEGLARVAGAVLFVGALAAFYTYLRPNPRIVDVAHTMALLLAFFAASAVLSYLLTATALPVVDDQLAAADRALGFDWLAWFDWVRARPALALLFEIVYLSAIPQLLAIALTHGFTDRPERNSELLWCLMASIAIIVPVSALLPAAGAWLEYDALRFGNEAQVHDFLAMRAGTMHELDLTRLEGLINLPSFHTTLGVLYAYVLRGRRILFGGATLLNAVMIVSVLTEGGHYLVDVIAGAAVAVVAIWAARRIENALSRRGASSGERHLIPAQPRADHSASALGN